MTEISEIERIRDMVIDIMVPLIDHCNNKDTITPYGIPNEIIADGAKAIEQHVEERINAEVRQAWDNALEDMCKRNTELLGKKEQYVIKARAEAEGLHIKKYIMTLPMEIRRAIMKHDSERIAQIKKGE